MCTRSFASRFDSGSSIEEHVRAAHHGPAERDALTLTARKLGGSSGQKILEMELGRDRLHLAVHLAHDRASARREKPREVECAPTAEAGTS